MEGIQSFEQKSSTELGHEIESKRNRVILVNRCEPSSSWSTANQPILTGVNNADSSTVNFGIIKRVRRWLFRCIDGSSSDRISRIKSNSSLLSISIQHIDTGPFPSNEWRTSKYTLMNFLPKNLFEQFRRFANFYFLTTAVLQIVLPFSPVGPTTSLLPLIFVVTTTSIKQAYEDYLRHKMDKELNNRLCHVLRNKKLVKIRSKDIKVGDFVYVKNNEEIPCDMILLSVGSGSTGSSSKANDRCYVTTANLDGEASLKSRSCFQILEQIGNVQQLDQMLLVIECERPNATLYEFSGNLRAPKGQKSYELLVNAVKELTNKGATKGESARNRSAITSKINSRTGNTSLSGFREGPEDRQKLIAQTIMNQMSKYRSRAEDSLSPLRQTGQQSANGYHEIPLDITNLLLRASRLRNTSFVYGLAVYTGRDTKLAHNSQVKPNKFSSTESTVNNFLIIAFLILIIFSLFGTIRYKLLFIPHADKKESEPFQEVFVSHFLLYNYLIPISLYVTLEFVKFFGTISVVEDKKMRAVVWRTLAAAPSVDSRSVPVNETMAGLQVKESSKTSLRSNKQYQHQERPKCNSSDLNEELGQVEVLFSDKTGTLTENSMRFMACSIGGSIFRSINEQLYYQPAELNRERIHKVAHQMALIRSNRSALIGNHSHDGTSSPGNKSPHSHYRVHRSKSSITSDTSRGFDHRQFPPAEQLKLIDKFDCHNERVLEFFICLCLCSTMTINEQRPLADCLPNQMQGAYDYRSASPDEQSLIEAAHAFGITMCKSNDRECFIVIEKSLTGSGLPQSKSPSKVSKKESPDRHQKIEFKALVEGKYSTNEYVVRHFERLLEFEFSSLRKRMSVIYKDCDNDSLLMVTKGSEELLDCLKIDTTATENEIDAILTHFEAFAKSGLRTLLVAKRILTNAEYEMILANLREAKLSIQNRDELMSAAYRRAENGLRLIGTTAVEDTLQDGVPETIANLKEAGIKVWLLTGDKVETAISVAYLCKLLDRDMVLFHLVRQQDMQACQRLLASFEHQLNNHLAIEAAGATRKTQSFKSRGVGSSVSSHRRPKQQAKSLSSKLHSKSIKSNELQSKSSSPPVSSSVDQRNFRFALVADGRSLHYAMKYAKEELARLCKQCSCVLGCRLSPLQKAEVVDMIKKSEECPITAAIGDGANDVSMIQEAHVGIGISGKEGKQAVNCSDFAIGRFQMLNRLLFVHGHLFYHRTANIIHYFFYKNFLFILPQFFYSYYNLSSTQSLYHPILLIGFNLFFTSLPILIYGLLEVNIPEHTLEMYPKFYTTNRANSQLRTSVFLSWLLLATVQALLGFYLLLISSHLLETGKQDCINGFAVVLYFVIVLTATIRLYSLAYSHNLYFNLSAILSCIALPVLLYTYSLLDLRAVIRDNSLYGQVKGYLTLPTFWLFIGTITMITVLPDLIWLIRDRMYHLRWVKTIMSSTNCD